jgi:hypothetical protein
MDWNKLQIDCYNIARNQGFYDGVDTEQDGDNHTVIQLSHAYQELGEVISDWFRLSYINATECADVLIVLMDIAQFNDVQLQEHIRPVNGARYVREEMQLLLSCAQLAEIHRTWRKERILSGRMIGMVFIDLLALCGEDALMDAVQDKMIINKRRPRRYGVR